MTNFCRLSARPRRTAPGRLLQALGMILVLALGLLARPAAANSVGGVMYAPSATNEAMAYARVIRIRHGGTNNGTLLGTFEHWHTDGTACPFVIRKSTDDGVSWTTITSVYDGITGTGHPWPTMFQPFLFELPQQLGSYPAGTILLVGNVCPGNVSETHFELWRSTNGGATFSYVSNFQTGNGLGAGIWEPFLGLDSSGSLLCYFSDERQSGTYSQFLGHIVSTNGGDTWGAEVKDVALSPQGLRPGMVTVAKTPGGTYVMSYEIVGLTNNEVHLKTSSDGDTWGSGYADAGSRVQTTDSRYLGSSPYLTWSPAGGPNGELLLAANHEFYVGGGGAPEERQVVFVDTNLASGVSATGWAWTPAPFVAMGSDNGVNYSPNLLPSLLGDGVRMTTETAGTSATGYVEGTQEANAGVLPYADPFAGDADPGWADYGGSWSVSGGIYSDAASGAGDKAVAGSTGWTDYTLDADVKMNSSGQAGVLVRASNPSTGGDALNGYYAGLNSGGGLVIGRENGGWTQLANVPVTGGLAVGTWYHLTFVASGSSLSATVHPSAGGASTTANATDSTFLTGAIGVRDYNTTASWKNVRVSPPVDGNGIESGAYYTLKNQQSVLYGLYPLYLNDGSGSVDTGQHVNEVQLNENGAPADNWKVDAMGSGYYRLTNQKSGLCLDDWGGGGAGTQLGMWYDIGAATQRWLITPESGGYDKLTLQNYGNTLCLDDSGGSTTDGNPIGIWTDNGLAPQRWAFSSPQFYTWP